MWQNVKQYTAKVHQTSPPRIFSGLHRPPFAAFTGAPAPAGHRGVGGAHDYKHQRHLGRCQRTLHVVIAWVPASLAQRQRRGTAADGGETQSGQDEDGTGVVSCYQTWVSRLCDEFFGWNMWQLKLMNLETYFCQWFLGIANLQDEFLKIQ